MRNPYFLFLNLHVFNISAFLKFGRLFLSAIFILSFLSAEAINYESNGTGPWQDATTWTPGGIPAAGDNVTIKAGHIVSMPSSGVPSTACNNLILEPGAIMILSSKAHTTNGTATINGQLLDIHNSGINTFVGKATIGVTGSWNTSGITNINNLVFQGGLEHNGSSMVVNKIKFTTNNQNLGGISPITTSGTVQIGSGITVTNTNTAGVTFGPASDLTGVDGTSSFVNQTTMFYQDKDAPMVTGVIDFSTVGNSVTYNRDGFTQDIAGTTYYNLIIGPDPTLADYHRTPVGNVTVNNNFTVQNGAQFLIKNFNIAVSGNTVIEGIFNDSDLSGTNTFAAVELANGGKIKGSNANYGSFSLTSLSTTGGTGRIEEGTVVVSGNTSVSSGATLEIGDYRGTKTFNTVNTAAGGTFNVTVNSDATVLIFNGIFTNNGTFSGQKGTYTFNNNFLTSSTGVVNITSTGNYICYADLTNNGTFNLTAGSFVFHNSNIGGTSPITINGAVTVAASATTVNSNTGGLSLFGTLNGGDAGSTFINQQSLTYRPGNRFVPMVTGILDASAAGNTFRYSRVNGTGIQHIKGITYHHLVFENGTNRTLNNGNVTVKGDLTNSINQDGPGIITMNGTGAQALGGGGIFDRLTINKTTGSMTLSSNLTVEITLNITNGKLVTGSNVLSLSTTGVLTETPTSFIEGFVEAVRTVGGATSNGFGGLGLTITTAVGKPMGATTVRRGTATPLLNGGMKRSYVVTPTTNSGLNASVEFNYLDADINGLIESNFVLLSNAGGAFADIGGTLNAGINQMTGVGINSFASLTLGDPASFPVEWLNFSALAMNSGVLLEWSTAFELNNDYFSIERSVDGNIFSPIGQVKGSGTSQEVSDYTFTDQEVLGLNQSKFYYRIKQVDFDGNFDYSSKIQVTLNPGANMELKAFPSPFNDHLNIELLSGHPNPVEIRMTDLNGKVIWQRRLVGVAGANAFNIPTSGLSSGIYIVSVTDGFQQRFVRVMKP